VHETQIREKNARVRIRCGLRYIRARAPKIGSFSHFGECRAEACLDVGELERIRLALVALQIRRRERDTLGIGSQRFVERTCDIGEPHAQRERSPQ
jgi:hypothetical protein